MKLKTLFRWLCFAAEPFYVVKNKAPDTSGVNDAAVESAKLGRDAFNWFSQEYANTADERAAAETRANAISDSQLASMNYALEQAKDAETYNKGTFRPLEQRLVSEAQTYDTQARRDQEAAGAVADVNREVAAQRLAAQQDLARAGVSPESGKSQALAEVGNIGAAKAAAGASYTARKNVEQQGYARMADAAALGRNLPSQQATQQALAGTAGAGSLNASGQSLAVTTSGADLMKTGFNTGLAGAKASGDLFGTQAGLQNQARGQDLNFVSSIFGSAMMKPSDKNIKSDTGKAIDGDEALAELNSIKVHKDWRYDPSKGGPNDGGQLHTGPMAQDVQAKMGDAVAPDGKSIDLISMNGKLMASMQAVTKRLERIEKKVN
ncbi:tail fiber domain-containing protein [Paucibacter sp. O1-1]|nr:tail fiber domain-containing protein [Paucibacter sp. O1-1]MDA3827863.1 tail fiber domain-containing protein [Paucibacter sp. O1-1]